jgi:hypothetical protein
MCWRGSCNLVIGHGFALGWPSGTHGSGELVYWVHAVTEAPILLHIAPRTLQPMRLHPKPTNQSAYLSAVLPGAREQGRFNYRYLFFQSSAQPVFGRLEQGDFGPLPDALGNNTVFTLCLGLGPPWRLWGVPLGSHRGWGVRAAGGLKAAMPCVPWDVLKFGALGVHGLFGVAMGACLPLVAWWVLHVAVVPASVLAIAMVGGPP